MIKLLKLVTGEEVIADLSDPQPQGDNYLLKKPVRIGLTHEGAATVPLSPFADCKEVEIAKAHVLFVLEPEEECRNAYSAHYGTGIVTASEADLSGLRVVGPEE